jgi:hypothetical protein
MIDVIGSLINGVITAIAMFIVSAVFGYLMFRYTKPWLTKTISEIWSEVRSSGLEVEFKIDGQKKRKVK